MRNTLYILLFTMSLSASAQLQPIGAGVYRWTEFPVKPGEGRETRHVMEGHSPHFEYLEIHATTQMKGAVPGKAHANEDIEEVIIVTEGKAKVTIEGKSAVLGEGSVVLLMPQQMHGLENVGDGKLTYYVMRYRSRKPMNIERGKFSGSSLLLNRDSLEFKSTEKGGRRNYFDRPTAMCENFEMHVTQINRKEPSHKPHSHVDGEIILVMQGKTEMEIDGKKYTGSKGDLYFINSNLMHGISNIGDEPCIYFAFKWRQ